MAYTEEIQTNVTIDHLGNKMVREATVTLKDGVEVGRINHRSVIAYDVEVPANIKAFITAKISKQPTRPDSA